MGSDSVRYDEAMNVRPKGQCKSMTGSVIDGRKKYPSTEEFAVDPSKVNAKVFERSQARRPGGSLRGSHGFSSVMCTCGTHPCTCRTEEAKANIIHEHTHEDPHDGHMPHKLEVRKPVRHPHGIENPDQGV